MSAAEFERVVDAGHILHHLVYWHAGMRSEANMDIFHRFGVTCKGLSVIRACVRANGALPDDDDAEALARSGELRHFADALGGFDAVDEALARSVTEERNRKSLQAHSPQTDEAGMYEWRALPRMQGFQLALRADLNELQAHGWQWVSTDTRDGDVTYLLRRLKDPAAPAVSSIGSWRLSLPRLLAPDTPDDDGSASTSPTTANDE